MKTGSPERSLCKPVALFTKVTPLCPEYDTTKAEKIPELPCAGSQEMISMSNPEKEAFLPLVSDVSGVSLV